MMMESVQTWNQRSGLSVLMGLSIRTCQESEGKEIRKQKRRLQRSISVLTRK